MSKRAVVLSADEAMRELVCPWLEAAGYEVTATDRGGEAARFMEAYGAELVVTDRIYPHWSGLGTIQAVKQRHPGVRVVVAGVRPDDPFLPMARAIGADAVLPAPLDRRRVVASV